MLAHDLRMAFRSLKRNPYLSALMIGAIAVGIAASMIAITLYNGRAGHPIPWKDGTLFAVTLDNRDEDPNQNTSPNDQYPPFQVTYQDARALYASEIPERSVMMYKASRVLTPERPGVKPFGVEVRVTTADFFGAFDVPFLYGSGWSRADDEAPGAVVVLSRFMNEKLFGGVNSVGREVLLSGRTYRVNGVLGAWMPRPRYYDMTNGSFDLSEDVFMPFGWMRALNLATSGSTNCVNTGSNFAIRRTVIAFRPT
jgi:putative ABC transport system permease protein